MLLLFFERRQENLMEFLTVPSTLLLQEQASKEGEERKRNENSLCIATARRIQPAA